MKTKNTTLAKRYGQKIKNLRAALKLTQEDFAKKISAHQIRIARWETGDSLISTDYLEKICKAFSIGMSYWDDYEGATLMTKTPEKNDTICQMFDRIQYLESKINSGAKI